jgi:hypothetical protein
VVGELNIISNKNMAYNNNSEVFMPFGSGMNAYGQVNQGKEKPIKEFLTDMEAIFDKATDLVQKSHPSPNADLAPKDCVNDIEPA